MTGRPDSVAIEVASSIRPEGVMKDARAAAAMAGALLGWVACTAPGRHLAAPAARPASYVRVRNVNWTDVTVFAVRGATRIRLGFVTSLTEASFLIPAASMPDNTLRLLIDPIGSDAEFLTDGITLAPGQRVELTVMPSLRMSNLTLVP